MKSTPIRTVALSVLFLAGPILLGACGVLGDDADPDEVIRRAASAFQETTTVRFSFDIDGTIPLDDMGMLALSSVAGEAERPANARADARVRFGGSTVTMELIAYDGQMWLRNVITGQWERAPTDLQYDPAAVFDEEQGIPTILQRLEDLEMRPPASVGGVEAWHLTASIATEAVLALTGDVWEADRLDVELWVARDDARLLRVQLREVGVTEPLSWDIRLTDHGDPVEISPPATGN